MVDLSRYPLLEPLSPRSPFTFTVSILHGCVLCRYKDLVRSHQRELKDQGVTTLPGLVTTTALEHAVREVERKAEQSYVMQTDHNIYLTKEDWDSRKGADHVSNRRLDTKVGALACDLLDEEGPLKVLFKSESFLNLIRQILDVPSLHRNIDPVGAVFVNIYKVGE